MTIFTVPPTSDHHHSNGGGEGGVHEVEWCGIIATVPIRRLINESHTFFIEFQEACKKGVEPELCVKYSRVYRAALHECTLGLQKEGME